MYLAQIHCTVSAYFSMEQCTALSSTLQLFEQGLLVCVTTTHRHTHTHHSL